MTAYRMLDKNFQMNFQNIFKKRLKITSNKDRCIYSFKNSTNFHSGQSFSTIHRGLSSALTKDAHNAKDPNPPLAAAALTAAAAAALIISETGVGAKSPSPPNIILLAVPFTRVS